MHPCGAPTPSPLDLHFMDGGSGLGACLGLTKGSWPGKPASPRPLSQSNVAASNAKLALFYDWLFFSPDKDSIMNIGAWLPPASAARPARCRPRRGLSRTAGPRGVGAAGAVLRSPRGLPGRSREVAGGATRPSPLVPAAWAWTRGGVCSGKGGLILPLCRVPGTRADEDYQPFWGSPPLGSAQWEWGAVGLGAGSEAALPVLVHRASHPGHAPLHEAPPGHHRHAPGLHVPRTCRPPRPAARGRARAPRTSGP